MSRDHDGQASVQLAGVLMALEGSRETDSVGEGDFAWSLALDRARELRAQADRLESFTPTAENVNALPEPVRRYVHDLATRCDPAGEVASRICAQDQASALELERVELMKALNRRYKERVE